MNESVRRACNARYSKMVAGNTAISIIHATMTLWLMRGSSWLVLPEHVAVLMGLLPVVLWLYQGAYAIDCERPRAEAMVRLGYELTLAGKWVRGAEEIE